MCFHICQQVQTHTRACSSHIMVLREKESKYRDSLYGQTEEEISWKKFYIHINEIQDWSNMKLVCNLQLYMKS